MADKAKNGKKSPAKNGTTKPKAAPKTTRAKAAKVKAPIVKANSAPKTSTPSKPGPASNGARYYVAEQSLDVRITTTKPLPQNCLAECTTFEDAKQAAVEHLVATIEAHVHERRLWEIKQSQSAK